MDFQTTFKFLQKLSKNNNREWFERNKPQYLGIKAEFETFLQDLLTEMIKFDEALATANPKKLAYRIYRDVRFSKDKRPYKNNISAAFSPKTRMDQEAGYYLHLQPGGKSFLGAGLYGADAENLPKIRQEIDYNTDRFLKILNDKKFKKFFPELRDYDKLKTAPKGYPKDHPHLDLLKHRSYVVKFDFTDAQVMDRKFLKKVLEVAKAAKPLNDFLAEAIA